MSCLSQRERDQGGFTLVEVVLGMALVALLGVAVAAISISGVVQINNDSRVRQREATTAQWVSVSFARDVQGAASVVAECGGGPGAGTHLLTVRASSNASRVEYRAVPGADSTHDLVRLECDVAGSTRTVVKGLVQAPTVTCTSVSGVVGACAAGSTPRVISLAVSRSSAFSFSLDGSRRMTDGNSTSDPAQAPTFMSLGGDTPLSVGGTSQLQVVGNALINRPTTGTTAVRLNGSSGSVGNPASWRLRVSGDFKLQSGSVCQNCATHSDKQPGTFTQPLPDPLRFLPAPSTSALTTRTNCPVQSGVRVCQPGIYEVEFPPSVGGGGVKDFRLEPGVYVLRGGMKVTNGSVSGSGVLFYNQSGSVNITGADIELSPNNTGTYSGILYFQARTNTAGFKILGNAALSSLTGTIYAPASTGVVLGGGGGTLSVGRVVGSSLEVFGNGTVIVDGS